MAIEVKEGSYHDQGFANIVGMNYGSSHTGIQDILSGDGDDNVNAANARILKIAKEEATSYEKSYFDTLTLYRG